MRTTTPSSPASLTVSVTRAAAIAASAPASAASARVKRLGAGQRARRVVDDDGVHVARRGERVADGGRAGGAALHEGQAQREVPRRAAERLLGRGAVAGRDGDDRARDAGRRERVERPGDHRPAGEGDERLGPAGAEPLAAAGRDDDRRGAGGQRVLRRTSRGSA